MRRRGHEGVPLWRFEETGGGGARVRTEETWTGAQVEADLHVPTATAALGQGPRTWLRALRTEAEARAGKR